MRNIIFVITIIIFPVILLHICTMHNSSRVFHRSGNIIVYNNLRIFFPDEWNSQQIRKQAHHFRSVSENHMRIFFIGWINIIRDFNIFPSLSDDGIFTRGYHRKIWSRGKTLFPVIGFCSVTIIG